ncbi:MAG: isopentenyl phosphate kinase family protein [Chloroflexi bacterium]|nr:isopentenyl phosphate kinase family protein [Chloroflexota bacterium]MBU1750774.1 isopentenyl phosphate kinase family protein [Chloroflexota bacterium]MBU1877800.1 isopentenyl phosphate kinase family protein [Chloroflexota bacterium]
MFGDTGSDELTLVKLGGSLITDKTQPFTPRPAVLARLAAEIHEALDTTGPLVIGHGSGSFGHVAAARYRTHEGLVGPDSVRGWAEVHDAAARLNRIVVGALLEADVPAVSVPPSAGCVAVNRRITRWELAPLRRLLDAGLVPVPYGDVVPDGAQGCAIASTEELFWYLSTAFPVRRVIMVGRVDGVLRGDGQLVQTLTANGFEELRENLVGAAGVDVTGGMLQKVEYLLALAARGVPGLILNGNVPGRLRDALLGEDVTGTVIRQTSTDA